MEMPQDQQALEELGLPSWISDFASMPSAAAPEPVAAVQEIPQMTTQQPPAAKDAWTDADSTELVKGIAPTLKGITEGYLKQSELQMQREMQKRKFLAEMMQKMQQAKAQQPLQTEAAKVNMLDQMYAAMQQTRNA